MPSPDDSTTGLLKRIRPRRTGAQGRGFPISDERLEAIYALRAQGLTFSDIRLRARTGGPSIRKALERFGGDPCIPGRGKRPPRPKE